MLTWGLEFKISSKSGGASDFKDHWHKNREEIKEQFCFLQYCGKASACVMLALNLDSSQGNQQEPGGTYVKTQPTSDCEPSHSLSSTRWRCDKGEPDGGAAGALIKWPVLVPEQGNCLDSYCCFISLSNENFFKNRKAYKYEYIPVVLAHQETITRTGS